ncbi:MAG: hypothetical protein R3C59_05970 [Planctomycetaceae bacterium]
MPTVFRLPTARMPSGFHQNQRLLLPVSAAIWVVGFLLWFFAQDLPNTGFSRPMIWNAIIDDSLTVLNPLNYAAPTEARYDAGWPYFSQRLPFLWHAGVLLAAATGMGLGACRLLLLLPRMAVLFSERCVLVLGSGLSLLSLWILICGLVGWLTPTALFSPGIAGLVVVVIARCAAWRRLPPDAVNDEGVVACGADSDRFGEIDLRWVRPVSVLIISVFALHIILGGMTPPFDFDVREYHMQGPKEWFQAGHIVPLEHNVYTSFPFLSEMLSLSAMVLHNDWWAGAITGKLTLTAFQFLSTLAVYAIGRRWLGQMPALIAAVAFLSTPWATRMSIIAYAEGAITFYLIAGVMLALLATCCRDLSVRWRLIAVTGFLSGSAMAAKYPGVLTVVLPIGLWLLFAVIRTPGAGRWSAVFRNGVAFVIGVVVAVGPWLLKNAMATGNPVYPLAYSVFGANDWSPVMDAKWKAGHSAPEHALAMIPHHLADLAVRNDWQNGLLFALAVPALLLTRRHLTVRLLWLHALWILFVWWSLTHRIDRFWVPLLPVLAVLAGAAWDLSSDRIWRRFIVGVVVICSVFNYGFCRLSPVGFHAGLIELQTARELPVRPDIKTLNNDLPPDARVLMVGEAQVFDATFDVVYNTVFDESIFQQWTSADQNAETPDADQRLRSASEIRSVLNANRITHIFVNWSEILRYRESYGYTEYVVPERFVDLQRMGILDEPLNLSVLSLSRLNDKQRQNILSWPGVETLRVDDDAVIDIQLFKVKR